MNEPLEKDYNREGIDLDLIFIYLNDGRRTPQNDEERKWLKNLQEIKDRGNGLELNFN